MEESNILEERLSLGLVIKRVQGWVIGMLKAWKVIFLGTFVIGGLFFAYQTLKKTNYTAQTTFVLESDATAGVGGQLSSLASLTGVNLGSLGEGSGVFQIDNIIELYRSYRMMKKTLLTQVEVSGNEERLITRYGRENELDRKWKGLGIDFEVPETQMVIKHDSVLKEVVEDILKKNLAVDKPNRKLTILSVSYKSNDATFAKAFNEVLVTHVNSFYLETKTKKTGENLRILAFQTDSVKKVLDDTLLELAKFEEENTNLNPLRARIRVPYQKLQIDVQAAGAVYQEMVKNLEIAKISHRNNQPLIQVIDEPVFPLKDDKMKWYKAMVYGLVLGGIMMVFFLTVKDVCRSALEEVE
ncbi:MAG: exopolysaccharide biosynthesis protein [Roseivirga sp.]|nr:exopolysaccharide biosynthesis protein [Roseivirga sp.]